MKISPWFTHPQAILDVYDFLLSDEYTVILKNYQSYIKKYPGSSKLSRISFCVRKNIHV